MTWGHPTSWTGLWLHLREMFKSQHRSAHGRAISIVHQNKNTDCQTGDLLFHKTKVPWTTKDALNSQMLKSEENVHPQTDEIQQMPFGKFLSERSWRKNQKFGKASHFGKWTKGLEQFCFSCDWMGPHTWDSSLRNSCPKNSRRKNCVGNANSALARRMEKECFGEKHPLPFSLTIRNGNSVLDPRSCLVAGGLGGRKRHLWSPQVSKSPSLAVWVSCTMDPFEAANWRRVTHFWDSETLTC